MATTRLRFLTAGESHGPSLTGILEGMPAGLPLDEATIARDLARRQQGFGAGGRMKIERDHARITAGVLAGTTTGAPIALSIENRDHAAWARRDIAPMTVPRPGHADLTGAVKYGYGDLRLSLERASARETAMRVAIGAVCRTLLAEFGVTVGGYVTSIGTVHVPPSVSPVAPASFVERFAAAERSDVRCHDEQVAARMHEAIQATIGARDTIGGTIEVAALHVPPGLGSHVHWDRRLGARIAAALMSIHAVKGVEIGDGFAATQRPGTLAHDVLHLEQTAIASHTNRAGGIEGGISNGAPIVARIAMKPIATTLEPLASVDLATGQAAITRYERSDFCQVPRAVPIAEAMLALVLADALLEKLGGDSIAELRPRFEALRAMRLEDLSMNNQPWRFGYET
ncbi:MAG TPA: chorismate synthase [Planctomycetota bacterium]|nr:chorismate synthase [Planctomycetota bacterium]